MKLKNILAGFIATALALSTFPGSVMAASSTMTIDVDTVVKDTVDIGISTDYAVANPVYKDGKINSSFIRTFNNFKMPLVRIGEGVTSSFEWKEAVGNLEDRIEQKLWGITGKVEAGPLEIVTAYEKVNPEVGFTITLNMITDTAQDAADFAEFLTGDASTEWGAKRVAYGHPEPVNVKVYELGNEVDSRMSVEDYIALSKEYIAAIEAVDADAKFAVHADTAIYNGVKRGDPADYDVWHKAILADAELTEDIDYLSLHTYYAYDQNGIMDEIINIVEDDIKAAGKEGQIKIYISEQAGYYLADDYTNPNPHGLKGVIETANIYSRMMTQDAVEMMAYHGLDSSEWKHVVYNSTTNNMYLNGIGHLSKLFAEYGRGEVLSASLTGFAEETTSSTSGLAVKDSDGNINLIFSNKNSTDLAVDVNFSDNGEYEIIRETKILPGGTAGLDSDINSTSNGIVADTYDYANKTLGETYTVPAYSVCAVKLQKAEAKKSNVIKSYDFADLTEVSNVTGDATLAIADGKLSVTSYEEVGNYAENYFHLTEENTNSVFNLEADINITGIADDGTSMLGVLLNTNITDEVYSVDNKIDLPLTEGAKKLKISVSEDGTVMAYVDDALIATQSGGLTNASGYIGFYVYDVNFTLDNVVISEFENTVEFEKPFTYEENFDNIEEGKLPEGWDIMSSMISAGVENGKLIVTSRDWYNVKGIQFTNLGNIKRNGLVMEADVRFIEHYGRNTTRPKTGFFYMADGADKSTGGLYTFWPQGEFSEIGSTKVPTASTTSLYGEGEGFLANETVSLKLVFNTETTSPDLYVNDKKITYYNTTGTESKGYLGIMMRACKAEFDNIKISGVQTSEYAKSAMVERLVDFTYEEDFDDYSNGQLPAGWTVVKSKDAVTAQVVDGALELKGGDWYKANYVLFEDLGKVERDSLIIEADITRAAATTNKNKNNSRGGFAYKAIINADGSVTAGYSSLYTDKAITYQQGISGEDGMSGTFTYAEGKTNTLQADKTLRFRAALNDSKSLATITVDGVPTTSNANFKDTEMTGSGLVGLYSVNSNIRIDNIKITGKRYVTVPNEFTYDASFKTATEAYLDEDAAIKDVKVTQIDALGNVMDITADAQISAVADGTDCTITVSYEEQVVKTLKCKLIERVLKKFTYEEDFDDYSNGQLPAGWTVVKSIDAVTAQVVDGALELKGGEWYKANYILFEDLGKVERDSLIIEADITRAAATTNDNKNNSRGGFAYKAIINADGSVTAGYSSLYTDKAITYQQGISGEDGMSGTFTYAEGKTNTLQADKTLRFRAALNDSKSLATITVDGVPTTSNANFKGTEMTGSGLVGLYSVNSNIRIDNIKITGVKYVPITDVYTQDAMFKTTTERYIDSAAAIADVKVTETAPDGSVSDITKDATITAEVSDDYVCTITVTFEGKVVKTLTCNLEVPVWEGFVYEENFDDIANGALPEGWALYQSGNGQGTATVQNGALELKANGWYEHVYLLLENLGEVQREGLTIEADITRIGAPGGNANNAAAGFAYAASVTDGAVTTDKTVLYTDKWKDNAAKQQGQSSGTGAGAADFFYQDIEGDQLYAGGTKHLKITFNNTTQLPVVSIDGVAPDTYSRNKGELTQSGLVGLYGFTSKVKIDNIRITGKRLKTPNAEDAMTAGAVKSVDGTPVVSAELKVTDTEINNVMFVATAYNKDTGAFVTFDNRIFNLQTYKTAKVNFKLDEITDYSSDKYLIKVMAIDKLTLQPVGEALEL